MTGRPAYVRPPNPPGVAPLSRDREDWDAELSQGPGWEEVTVTVTMPPTKSQYVQTEAPRTVDKAIQTCDEDEEEFAETTDRVKPRGSWCAIQ